MLRSFGLKRLRLVVLLLIIASCGKDENPIIPPEPETKIPESTKAIDSTDFNNYFISFSSDSSTITLKSEASSKYNLKINDILVIPNGEGMLKKIKNIQTSNQQVLINLEDATLTEAVEKGTINFELTLSSNQIKKLDGGDGVEFRQAAAKIGNYYPIIVAIDKVLFDQDNNPNTIFDQIKLVGEFEILPIIKGTIEIDNFDIKKVELGYELTKTTNLSFTIGTLSLVGNLFEFRLPIRSFPTFIVSVGGVPVTITPTLDFVGGVTVGVSSTVESKVTQSTTYTAKILYENNSWTPYYNESVNYNVEKPIINGTIKAEAFVKPEVGLKFYHIFTAYLNAKVAQGIEANPGGTPWWEIYRSLSISAGFRAEILKKTFLDYNYQFVDYRVKIADSGINNTKPTANFQFTPNTGNITTRFEFDASSSNDGEDPSAALQVRWDWNNDGLWDTDYSNEKLIVHQFTEPGTHTINMEVKDIPGLTDHILKTVTVSNTTMNNGLVAYYPFNGDFNDYSGNELHLQEFGNLESVMDRKGNQNNAIYFDGINDWLYQTRNELLLPQVFTINFWLKHSGLENIQDVIVSTLDIPDVGGYQIVINTPYGFEADIRNTSNTWNPFPVNYSSTDWTMATVILTTERVKIYFNGQEKLNQPYTLGVHYAGTNNFRIGTNPHHWPSSVVYYKGTLDEFRLYNRELTYEEIQNLYTE